METVLHLPGPAAARRRQIAALALWRLRAPLLAFELDAEWGVAPDLLDALFRAAASAPGDHSLRTCEAALTELNATPLFASSPEIEPETFQLIQLETLAALLAFAETLTGQGRAGATDERARRDETDGPEGKAGSGGKAGSDSHNGHDGIDAFDGLDRVVEAIVECPRGLANYLDRLVEASFHSHPAEEAHRRYLAELPAPVRDRGLGYLASRNLVVESACHDALLTLPPTAGLLDTPTGHDLLARCESFGTEMVAFIRWL